jgi:glycosyltransferase involved in cell wall biosynthesis
LRILILVDCYYPSPKSSAKLVHDLGIELHRRGHSVVVLAPSDGVCEPFTISIEDDLLVAKVRAVNIKSWNKPLRAMAEARLSANLWRRAKTFLRENRCDLILFYSPSIFFGPLVRKLKALWRCPAYLILRDIFPEWAVDAGILRRGLVYRYLRRVEANQYHSADLIAVQSPGNLEYFARTFPQQQFHLKVLYNWMLLNEPERPQTCWRTKLGLEDKFVFLYGGNIGIAQDVNNLLRLAARLASRSDIRFLLVGSGSEAARLKSSIAAHKLGNIRVLPAVSQDEYLSMLSEFDAGLISLDARFKTHNIPGKLLSYLYWGLPVLASVNPGNDLFDLINKNRAGFCCVNGEDENLVAAAKRLVDHPDLRYEMGRNARQLLERTFSVRVAVDQILSHLKETGIRFCAANLLPQVRAEEQATRQMTRHPVSQAALRGSLEPS